MKIICIYNGWFVNVTLVWGMDEPYVIYTGVAKKLSDPIQNKQTLKILFQP